VPGAGAAELELARRVEVYAGKVKGPGRDVVKRFAKALEVIPRTLAENAKRGREGNRVVTQLLGAHDATEPFDGAGWVVDVKAEPPSDGTILANSGSVSYPILDSLAVKRRAIELATQAAGLVLSIDSNVMSGQATGAGLFGSFNTPVDIIIKTSLSHIAMISFLTGILATVYVVTVVYVYSARSRELTENLIQGLPSACVKFSLRRSIGWIKKLFL